MFFSKRRLLLTKMAKWPTVGKTKITGSNKSKTATPDAVSIKQPKTIF